VAIAATADATAPADFRGEKRSNQTHRSTTDPDARLYRKDRGWRRSCALSAMADGEPLRPESSMLGSPAFRDMPSGWRRST